MKKTILFLVLCAGITGVWASEQLTLEAPAIAAVEPNEPVVTTIEKTDPLINLPSSIEISVKFAATSKKPEPHSVDLIL